MSDAATSAPAPSSSATVLEMSSVHPTPAGGASLAIVAPAPAPPAKELDHKSELDTTTPVGTTAPPAAEVNPDEVNNAPRMNPLAIYMLFLSFGVRAFGGPVAQINMMRDELVAKAKWITPAKFTRVYAVYQILPGPEATELACYFGLLAGGRLGSFLGGLGFITPGFLLMLLLSWLHSLYGVADNDIFLAVFGAIQPAVCAMVIRAAHKIGESGCKSPTTKQFDKCLLFIAAAGAFESVLRVNFFITKIHLALVYVAYVRGRTALAALIAFGGFAIFIGVILGIGPMQELIPLGVGAARTLGNTYAAHFIVGLLGGLVTFGGAYTAIPFMQFEAVTDGSWVSNKLFLDSLALCALLPTPLVMFSTMIGFGAGGIVGAILMTIGMFLPAFSFTLIGHEIFEKLANHQGVVGQVLDSMTATVVGLVAITGLQLMRSAITRPLDAVIFVGSLYTVYNLKHPYTPVFVVIAAALAGQILYNGG